MPVGWAPALSFGVENLHNRQAEKKLNPMVRSICLGRILDRGEAREEETTARTLKCQGTFWSICQVRASELACRYGGFQTEREL